MKHKHADVLIALAEGKIVQWERGSMYGTQTGVWIDFNPDINGSPLELSGRQFNWRIKPEPKPDVVRYLGMQEFCFGKWEYAEDDFDKISHWPCKLKLTFNGETGKLMTAEVL